MAQLIVRPLAEADLDAAFAWCERRSVGLGVDFLRSVDACFGTVAELPLAFPVVYRRVHRSLLRRFPHAVFYSTDIVFMRQADLKPIYETIPRTAPHAVKAELIATILRRKLNGNFTSEMDNNFSTRIECPVSRSVPSTCPMGLPSASPLAEPGAIRLRSSGPARCNRTPPGTRRPEQGQFAVNRAAMSRDPHPDEGDPGRAHRPSTLRIGSAPSASAARMASCPARWMETGFNARSATTKPSSNAARIAGFRTLEPYVWPSLSMSASMSASVSIPASWSSSMPTPMASSPAPRRRDRTWRSASGRRDPSGLMRLPPLRNATPTPPIRPRDRRPRRPAN